MTLHCVEGKGTNVSLNMKHIFCATFLYKWIINYKWFFFFASLNNSNEIKTSLDYEELVPYIIDPHWIRLRKLSFLACWIVFFIIFFAACISAAISGSCGNLQNISSMPSASKIDNAVPMTYETTAILSVVIDKAIAGD